jgi:HAD superfamily hydrolase (TIGR01509 family)
VPVAMARLETYHKLNGHLIRPYAGVTEVLQRIRQNGTQLAIWTGRDRSSAAGLLHQHRLDHYFATIVCGDDLTSHKPDAAGLVEIMRRLGVSAGETLFVGDADVDVLGGAACGVDTLLIRHGRVVEKAILGQAWQSVASPSEAFEVVLTRIAKNA